MRSFRESRRPLSRFTHEDYSVAIIEKLFAEVIERHPSNTRNSKIFATEVTALIAKRSQGSPSLFWKDIISGQLDADRMDYLLRDSLHAGVSYGKYDLDRIVSSVCAVERPKEESEEPKIAITKGGAYAAEALIVARYWMHKQVYFHKTRLACNYHLEEAVRHILLEDMPADAKAAFYSRPDTLEELNEFLKWDDYKVMGLLAAGHGGEHGERLMERNHYRLVCELTEFDSTPQELIESSQRNEAIIKQLGSLVKHVTQPKTLWYKSKANDLILVEDDTRKQIGFLSGYSALLRSINFGSLRFVYADKPDISEAKQIYQTFLQHESEAERAKPIEGAEMPPQAVDITSTSTEPSQLTLSSPPTPTKLVQRETLPQKGIQNAG